MPVIDRNFGLLIAFILPGFVSLAGASHYSPTIAGWMTVPPQADPSVGGFLYVALGSLAAGMIASAFRWLIIDAMHHRRGLVAPKLDFSRLQENLAAYELAVEHNYRHYQFYANMIPATLFYAVANQVFEGRWRIFSLVCLAALETVLWLTSRDCLQRFYQRTSQLLAAATRETACPSPSAARTPLRNPTD
jgi:hypothetical protein